jgi:hypothetical protein
LLVLHQPNRLPDVLVLVVVVPWVIDAIFSVGKWAELGRECGRTMNPNGVERTAARREGIEDLRADIW